MSVIRDDSTLLDSVKTSESPAYDPKHITNFTKDRSLLKSESKNLSWRDAAKSVQLKPRNPYPRIHEFERSVLHTLRTLRAQFKYGLCPHCSRPMIDAVLPQHVAECEKRLNAKKQEIKNEPNASIPKVEETVSSSNKKRKRGGDDDSSNGTLSKDTENEITKSASKPTTSGQNGSASTSNSAKKSKPNTKAKTAKTKIAKPPKVAKPSKEKLSAVFHPDKNCGVLMPNNQPCMRSLTCKQHPMGAKRAVTGRSAPYDILLSNYHHQHQIKQAQLSAHAAQVAQMEDDQLHENLARENPEREVHQVLEGVTRVYCAPLAQGTIISSSIRSNDFKLREMLSATLLPRRLPPTGDVLYGRSLTFKPDAPEQYSYVRSQAVQQAIFLSQMQQRHMQLKKQHDSGVVNSTTSGMSSGPGSPMFASQDTPQAQMQQVSSRILAQQRARQIQQPK